MRSPLIGHRVPGFYDGVRIFLLLLLLLVLVLVLVLVYQNSHGVDAFHLLNLLSKAPLPARTIRRGRGHCCETERHYLLRAIGSETLCYHLRQL